MSSHTEDRIRQLCRKAITVQTDAEVEAIIPELRSAIHEHIVLAKELLEGQASAIAFLDTKKSNQRAA